MKNETRWGFRTRNLADRLGATSAGLGTASAGLGTARAGLGTARAGLGVLRLTLLGAVVLLGGCMSGGPAPNSVRNTAQTAPADLQMTCASAAATSLGVDSSSVLPVSSSQLDAQSYQVDLDARGTRATCIVDANGNVVSVKKV